MIKTLLKYAGPYKKESILAPLCVTAEVLLEITIPLLMSRIVDVGIANRDLAYVAKLGLLMILMALAGMVMGCLLYTSPSPRDMRRSRMPSSA